MNNFEYMRYVSFGQYLPTGSWIHRLDPRTRLVAAILLLAAATFTRHTSGLLVGLALALGLLALGRIPLGYALRSLTTPLPFLLILAALQVLFYRVGQPTLVFVHYGWLEISDASLLSAANLLLRFTGLILLITLASCCISTSELIQAGESLLSPFTRLGLPATDLVMMVQVMLRFVPFLALAAERIAKAQASRGADWGTRQGGALQRARQAFPLIVPLFLTALRRAENLAIAMQARGYGEQPHRTSMFEMEFRWIDGLALVGATTLTVLILVL